MSDMPPEKSTETSAPVPKPKRKGVSLKALLIGAGITVASVAALAGLGLVALDTAPGKRFLVAQIVKQSPANGLKIHLDRLDGSIYGDLTAHGLTLSDPKGVFLKSPSVRLDWRPFAFLSNHVDVRHLSSPRIEVLRQPSFNPSPDKKPEPFKLPDLKIDIDDVDLKKIYLAEAVTGQAQTLSLKGNAHLLKGRAQIDARLSGDKGDRAVLTLDAAPKNNRLSLNADINAPANGAITHLLKLDAPLNANLSGQGDWKTWNGTLRATTGELPLANLVLTARDGRFGVKGTARPDHLLGPSLTALFEPTLTIDMDGTFKDRRAEGTLKLGSDALSLDVQGLIDLGRSRFEKVRLNAAVLKPATLAKGMNGNDIIAELHLDGAFKAPIIDYALSAKTLGFNDVIIHDLSAKGRSRIDGDHLLIPVSASARHITGLNAAAETLVSNIRIDGDLAVNGDLILSDNLKIRSDKVNGTAILLADISEGRYEGALKGRINQYLIAGIGVFNLMIDADLKRLNDGGFGIVGKVDGQSLRIDHEALSNFLGGNAKFSGAMNTTASGDVILQRLTLNAPDFNLVSAKGRYGKNGTLDFDLAAQSVKYGPVTAEVGGTLKAPTAVLRAESPGLGIELNALTARLETEAGGYHVTADGGSAYGPLVADVVIETGEGPLTIDVAKATVAGIDASGQIVQSDAGPFTGALALRGQGLTGTATLMGFDAVQGAKISARINNMQVPGAQEIRIGRGIIDATARLEDAAIIVADVQMADVRYQDMWIATSRAKVNLTGPRGTVQLVATGDARAPFELAANARLEPDTLTVAAKGKAGGVAFALEKPARVIKRGDDWVLTPTVLTTPQGKVDLAGRFGDEIRVQSRFDKFDLSLANIVNPDLGLGGTVTGSVDYAQRGKAFPEARLQLTFNDLTRSTIARVSTPINMQVDGRLDASDTRLKGVIRQGSAVIGRFDARLDPQGDGPWVDQLMNAGLNGGLRFNGPSGVLFSLAGQADQQMSGNIALAADLSGRLNDPRLNGMVKGNNLTYEHLTFGTRIRRIALEGRFSNDQLELQKFEGRAGDGTVSATGFIGLSAADDFPIRLNAKLQDARLASSDAIASTVSGTIDITNDAANGPWIRGDLRLPELKYEVVFQGASKVDTLEGVRFKGARTPGDTAAKTGKAAPSLWNLDIRVRADNQIFVNGMGLESEWRMNLRASGTTRAPVVVGTMNVIRGTYAFGGREFDIDKGVITFDGGTLGNPDIDLTASTVVDDITGTITIAGTAQAPQIVFGSNPSLPQDEILSRLLFGESVTNLSATQALQLAASLNSLQGGGLNPLGKLKSVTGIDRLRVLGADDTTGRGTAVAAGQYLTNDIYVEIVTDAKGFTATQLEIALSRSLSILTQTGSTTGTSVNLRYSRDY